jgi:ribosomal protein L7/L12
MSNYYWLFLILSVGSLTPLLAGHVNRLAEVERKINLLLEKLGVDPHASVAPSQAVEELARDPARKIAAIRRYRRETGAGLKDAAKVIEAIRTGDSH